MSVTAVLEASPTKLLYQQSASCKGVITNNGRTVLAHLNPTTVGATPTIVVTDVQTGTQTRFSRQLGQEQDTPIVSLQPGALREFKFSLTAEVTIPGPGVYDVQLHYTWEGGETLTPPVRFEFAPSNPLTLDIVTCKGGPAPLQFAAFLHRADPRDAGGELWLAQMFLGGKPTVQTCTRLDAVKLLVHPRQSIPPNMDCALHWTAWVNANELRVVLRKSGAGVAPLSVALDAADYRIIPPLLVNVSKTGEPEGVDVLLYRTDASGGRLVSKRLLLSGKPAGDVAFPLPGMAPSWGQTCYLSNRRRHSFFLALEQGKQVLKHAPWPIAAGAAPTARTAAAWPSPFGVAAAAQDESDGVFGAVLVNAGDPAQNEYKFAPWALEGDQVALRPEIPIAWSDRRHGINMAILRVGSSGQPWALLRSGRDQKWSWCNAEGRVTPLSGLAENLQLPADIVFRGGDDPVIVFAEPGRGLQLVKPG